MMAWTVTFTPDNDKEDVGSATAVWNAGLADEFTFTARIRANRDGIAEFKKDALAAKDERDATATKGTTLAADIEAEMNKAEVR